MGQDSSAVSTPTTSKKPKLVRIGWKALVHEEDLLRKPWVKGAIARLEDKYRRNDRILKAQAWWVFPDKDICTHYDEPQIVVTIVGPGPSTTPCYECAGNG